MVGLASCQIKAGSPSRGERLAKYNQVKTEQNLNFFLPINENRDISWDKKKWMQQIAMCFLWKIYTIYSICYPNRKDM